MTLLTGFDVVQIGPGAAAAVCGRLLADAGASVTCIDPAAADSPLKVYLDHAKGIAADEELFPERRREQHRHRRNRGA